MKLKLTIMIPIMVALISSTVFTQQDTSRSLFGINFSGFLKTDMFFDSRQVEEIREGHFLLYPKDENPDIFGDDINEKSSMNILSIQTRVKGDITGPDVMGAKTSGVLEMAFFGSAGSNINTLRLRHAFLKLDWEKTSILVGQYWHPMFITECFPEVVSFNTGVPFQPFSRNPQLRLIQKAGPVEFNLALLSQRDFTSTGPVDASSVYLRNAVLPEAQIGLKYKSSRQVLGILVGYKAIQPRLETTKGVITDKKATGLTAMAFAKFDVKGLTVKLEGIYGQNLTNMTMLGGYAVKSFDTTTGLEEYTPINTISLWGEIVYGKRVQFALFGGYTKNLGAADNLLPGDEYSGNIYYARGYTNEGSGIESVMRIAPRLIFNVGKIRFAGEIEYTSAKYGDVVDNDKGKVNENTRTVSNVRALLAFYLFF